MTKTVAVLGLLAVLAGLFLSERSDEPRLGLGYQDCVYPAPPSLDRQPAPHALIVQIDWLLFHSGEVRL